MKTASAEHGTNTSFVGFEIYGKGGSVCASVKKIGIIQCIINQFFSETIKTTIAGYEMKGNRQDRNEARARLSAWTTP